MHLEPDTGLITPILITNLIDLIIIVMINSYRGFMGPHLPYSLYSLCKV